MRKKSLRPNGLLTDFLKVETNPYQKVFNVFTVWGIYILWCFFMAKVLGVFVPEFREQIQIFISKPDSPALVFLSSCIMAPILEEVLFRYPLGFIRKVRRDFLIPAVLFSSFLFGYGHGSNINVLFQGVGGLLFSWVYLKNGNSLLSSMSAHFLINFSIFMNITN